MLLKKSKRIPTLFALTLLAIALGLGIFLDLYQKKLDENIKTLYAPKKLSIVNLTDKSVTLTWQTNTPTTGQVIYGTGNKLENTQTDLREKTTGKKHLSHFVTLTNLRPETTYFFHLKSEDKIYPNSPLQIKTGPQLKVTNSINKPLTGSLVDPSLNPLEDGLVYLEIEGASRLGTYTINGGNFILPLTELRTEDLQRSFDIKNVTEGNLVVLQGTQSSKYKISIPPDSRILQSLILGQNLDLTKSIPLENKEATSSAVISVKYDLNEDRKVNSLDLIFVSQSMNKFPLIRKADLNEDNRVDQKDLDLIKREVQ